jgi:hypothetical protein
MVGGGYCHTAFSWHRCATGTCLVIAGAYLSCYTWCAPAIYCAAGPLCGPDSCLLCTMYVCLLSSIISKPQPVLHGLPPLSTALQGRCVGLTAATPARLTPACYVS